MGVDAPNVASDPAESMSPMFGKAFGTPEDVSSTRQAQHSQSNDTPTDVNMNAVVARAQAGTLVRMGESFEANADRRNKIADDKYANLKLG